MDGSQNHGGSDNTFPPGTVLLDDRLTEKLILHPTPSDDPNDPLNWSKWRKIVNFGLALFYVLFTFVMLDIIGIALDGYTQELDLTYELFNDAIAMNYAGLALGCIFFNPFVHKYGRRPLYLISSVIQLVAAIWSAAIHTGGELIAVNFLSGIGGAISETIVMITIVDMFYLHQHARMNGLYLMIQSIGAFGGPIAAGFIVESQGWRWIWWWTAIFLGVNLVLVLLFFEETKYVPTLGSQTTSQRTRSPSQEKHTITKDGKGTETLDQDGIQSESDAIPLLKPYSKRLALYTKTSTPIRHHFYQPPIMFFTFPAVTYTAIIYGALLAWYAIVTSAFSFFLLEPPYNFRPAGVGLFSIGPGVGTILGIVTGAPLSDWSIVWLARRNKGIYEPEMRLWLAIPGALLVSGGMLMFGISLAMGHPWPVLAIGAGIFGYGLTLTGDIALTYLTDCYQDILADALVSVVFVRNGISVIIMFSYTPWIERLGIQNTFVCAAMLSLICFIAPIVVLIYGKEARRRSGPKYRLYAMRQPVRRAIS